MILSSLDPAPRNSFSFTMFNWCLRVTHLTSKSNYASVICNFITSIDGNILERNQVTFPISSYKILFPSPLYFC